MCSNSLSHQPCLASRHVAIFSAYSLPLAIARISASDTRRLAFGLQIMFNLYSFGQSISDTRTAQKQVWEYVVRTPLEVNFDATGRPFRTPPELISKPSEQHSAKSRRISGLLKSMVRAWTIDQSSGKSTDVTNQLHGCRQQGWILDAASHGALAT